MRSVALVLLSVLAAGCGGSASTSDWIERLQAREASVRLQAIKALAQRRSDAALVVPALTKRLRDDNAFVRRDAAEVLGGLGPEAAAAVPELKLLLRDKNAGVRRTAARALKEIVPGREHELK